MCAKCFETGNNFVNKNKPSNCWPVADSREEQSTVSVLHQYCPSQVLLTPSMKACPFQGVGAQGPRNFRYFTTRYVSGAPKHCIVSVHSNWSHSYRSVKQMAHGMLMSLVSSQQLLPELTIRYQTSPGHASTKHHIKVLFILSLEKPDV